MSFSHREETRGDRVLDILTDETAGIRIVVSRLGAEIVSLARRDARGEWIGFLYRDGDLTKPESGWANHATVMGYFLHRLKDGHSLYRGKRIEGGTHSFLRSKVWQRADVSTDEGWLTYRITRANYTPLEYPLDVSLDLTYAIVGEAVRVTFAFENHETDLTAHVGFGLHPGFGTTAPSFRAEGSAADEPRDRTSGGPTGSVDSARDDFVFEMPPGLYRRHFSPTNYLLGETEEIRHAGGEMPFPKEKLAGSYILELVDVPERTFTFRDFPSGRAVVFDLREVPYLTLWSDGGPFLCVEPCWGLTDHYQQRPFEDKEGIQTIAAGETLTTSFAMSPQLIGAR